MKIILVCSTIIDGKKVPGTTTVDKETVKTCIDCSDSEARAAINRQHAKLATADDKVNYPAKAAK